MNHYYTTDGERLSQATLDRRIRRAKDLLIERQRDENGYNFCEDCGNGDGWLDCSHNLSVKRCKENRMAELCYSLANLRVRCRSCHKKHDKC